MLCETGHGVHIFLVVTHVNFNVIRMTYLKKFISCHCLKSICPIIIYHHVRRYAADNDNFINCKFTNMFLKINLGLSRNLYTLKYVLLSKIWGVVLGIPDFTLNVSISVKFKAMHVEFS